LLVGWLVVWLVGWMVGWLVGWLFGWLVGCLAAGRWPLAAGGLILENGYLYGRPEWESRIGPTSTLIRLPLE